MGTDLESLHEKSTIWEDGHDEKQSSEPDRTANEKEVESNVVDWDGPGGPQNPRNWPTWRRMVQVVLVSIFLLTA